MGAETSYTIQWLNSDYSRNFEILYKLLFRRLFLFARTFLMDDETAEDIVQDVFMSLWKKSKDLRKDTLLQPYLYASVRNLCIDYHRKLNIQDKYQKHLQTVEALTGWENESSEKEEKIKKLFAKLPEKQRQVLELSIAKGLKYKEIAQQLGIEEETVHTHIKRAYQFFRKHLPGMALLLMWYMKQK